MAVGRGGRRVGRRFGDQTYAADNLLQQVKQRGTLIVGLEGTYPPFSFQGKTAS